ncbi:hypothetical protein HAP41_0000044325 [Bradyrhizobium barranii subsp. apii]|uniref:Uncharacterized protein n=1 Tax=Bradyrhizobium barranii subsp. apii TaxID=2819348 RepID=A0A8T5V1M8_9BRAD|nr:hypothetical protein [Bradyrhizobium barranii]UPT87138.1 hypothetical protein HAP41_0000044325 [Bradyrhizobium barranii subsp. apii]
MYNRINGLSDFQSSRFVEADEQWDANSFADAFANMRLAAPGPSGCGFRFIPAGYSDLKPAIVPI